MISIYAADSTPIPYSKMIFSGGEINVSIGEVGAVYPTGAVTLYCKLKNSEDIMELLLVVDSLKRSSPVKKLILNLPYVPYARQDRVCNPGEALSIKVFCDLINSMNFDKVIICDPHSDVTTALLNNVEVTPLRIHLRGLPKEVFNQDTTLISPDAGALKKVYSVAKDFKIKEVIRADKTRDVSTGQLSGTVVYGDVSGKKLLIIDDIFDRGGTFIMLGKELKRLGAAEVNLYVTHGIFSKGVDVLDGAIDKVFCPEIWTENTQGRNLKGILTRI